MNYYCIELRACNGLVTVKNGLAHLFLDEYELREEMFQMILGEFIITAYLKNILYKYLEEDCEFEEIHNIEIRDDFTFGELKDPSLGFWLVRPKSKGEFKHIIYYSNSHLVVSQPLLDLLLINNGYKDYFAGSHLGKKYELLTSRLFLSKPIQEYFSNNFIEDQDFINNKLKEISNESRKRKGLKPLY